MPALNQEQYRPQMHAALAEISALVFDAPGFREASFRFRDPIGPDANAELSIRPVTVAGDPLWQIVRRDKAAGLLGAQNNPQPWYGQLMTTPQTIAYLLQVNYWLQRYNIRIV